MEFVRSSFKKDYSIVDPRMYVIVRKELDATYRSVQGAHALAQYAIENIGYFRLWSNEYLIFLGVRFQSGIQKEMERLDKLGLKYSVFYEPDLLQNTAIACYASPEVFQHLDLA